MRDSDQKETPRLGKKQRQWLWFIGLAAGGMAAMALAGSGVRMLLGMN